MGKVVDGTVQCIRKGHTQHESAGGQLLWSQRVSVGLWHFLSQTAIESIRSDLAPTDNIAAVVSSFNYYIYTHIFSVCIAKRT